jgi:hypothetical protein
MKGSLPEQLTSIKDNVTHKTTADRKTLSVDSFESKSKVPSILHEHPCILTFTANSNSDMQGTNLDGQYQDRSTSQRRYSSAKSLEKLANETQLLIE